MEVLHDRGPATPVDVDRWTGASGYLIGGRLVLTAAHAVDYRRDLGDGEQLLVRTIEGSEFPAEVLLVCDEPSLVDLALLEISAPQFGETLPPIVFVRVDRDSPAPMPGCWAVGFPRFGEAGPVLGGGSRRETWQVRGDVLPGGKLRSGLLSLQVTSTPRTSLASLAGSAWEGMSGAVVFATDPDDGEQGVGVVTTHHRAEGESALTVVPITAVAGLPAEAQWWHQLGVPGPDALPVLPRQLRQGQPVRLVPRPPGGSPDGAGQVMVGEIPARPAAFLERQAVAQLAAAWDAGMRVAVVQAVTGGPGVGKTQAASAYARDRAAAGWPLVAWVTAETRDQLLTGLANVAVAVDVADADGDSAVSAKNVRRYLEKCPGPALVVFDNATDVDGLVAFLPTVGAAQVVITSTDRAFTRLGMTVDIGLFTPEQSVAYLKERTGLADADAAAAVAAELGYLPLALAQAATVISQQSLDYATYQRRLHQAPAARYLTRHAGDPYPRGAVEAIALAIHSVEDQDDSGLTRVIMGLLSVLSAEGVSRSILAGLAGAPSTALAIGSAPKSDEAVDQALGRLVGGSILTRSETGQAFSMHRLVSRVVRERDEAEERLLSTLRVAVALLQGLQVPEEDGWLRREAGSQLVEQVSAVWAASTGRAADDDPQFREVTGQLISLRNWSVRQLTVAADLSRAIGLGVTVLADCEGLSGPEHPDTLSSRNNLAAAYESAGQLGEAIDLYERNLADRERLLGPDHPDTLTSRGNLAGAYESAGWPRKANDLYERNLADRERLLGPDHPDTLTSRGNLAGAYGSAGRLREAIALYERNLADSVRLLGPDHPGSLTARNNLAGAYINVGRSGEAIALYERNLADRERLLGPDHPGTLTARDNLASAYMWAHRLRKTIDLYERNLADRVRLLGPDHPGTLTARNNLALAYRYAGRLREAIALHERNLADSERLLGPDHPGTLTARNNLAGACTLAGRLHRAFSLRRLNAAEARRALEVGHPWRRIYRRRFWWYLPIPVILAMLALGAVWLMWTGDYYGAIVVLLCLALVVLAAPTFRLFQRFQAARDWRFLSSPRYEQLRHPIVRATRQDIRRV